MANKNLFFFNQKEIKIFKFSFLKMFLYIYGSKIFHLLIKKCPNLFYLPKDLISSESILTGNHEQHLKEFIDKASQKYNDFFIDIGGHIGLYSILLLNKFKRIYTFEPNPIIFKILTVNKILNDQKNKIQLKNFGLGFKSSTRELAMPRCNTGGAVVKFKKRNYNISSSKFNLKKKGGGVIKTFVKIKTVKNEFNKILVEIKNKKFKKGFIKIDAENSSYIILKEILKLDLKIDTCIISEINGVKDLELRRLFKLHTSYYFFFHTASNFFYTQKNKINKIKNLFFDKIENKLIPFEIFYSNGYSISKNPFYSVDLVLIKK